MSIKIGKLSLGKFIKSYLGLRFIDALEVYYLKEENLFYPIISKSACSTIKQDIIRKYNPEFSSKFPEIHQIDPSDETDGNVLRLHFYTFKDYKTFCKGKKACLVIRNPYERMYSCYLDIQKRKNIMYEDPSGLTNHFGITSEISLSDFISKIKKLPDHLSDRHFRSQSVFLQHGVMDVLKSVQIVALENYKGTGNKSEKLNTNSKKITPELVQELIQDKAFQIRFSEDIRLYNEHK